MGERATTGPWQVGERCSPEDWTQHTLRASAHALHGGTRAKLKSYFLDLEGVCQGSGVGHRPRRLKRGLRPQGQRMQGQEGSSSQPDDPRSFLKDGAFELDSGPFGCGSGLSTGKRFFLLFSSTHHSAWHTSGF